MDDKPVSDAEEETGILLNVFPTGIWQRVLANVHLAEEYTRIANSSPTFKSSWLMPHWNRVIFPKLLNLLDSQLGGYHTPKGKNNLLNLRQVCHDWKFEVDKFLQNVPEHFLFDNEMDWGHHKNDPRPKIYRAWNESVIRSFQDVTKFRDKFDASHLPQNLNPLLIRELHIWMDLDMENVSEYVQVILDFLRDYGNHVWHFKLRIFIEAGGQFGVGEWIRGILERLPGLRTLRFPVDEDPNFFEQPPWPQMFEQMQDYWQRNNMPCFANLSLLGEAGLPWPLLMALLKANPKLISLESTSLARTATSCATYEAQVPQNLQELSITFSDPRELEIFERAIVPWNLTKLHVLTSTLCTELPRLMTIVDSKFGQTLRQLGVTWLSIPSQPGVRVAPLKMPNLEAFQLSVIGFAPNLDFLLSLGPTLKRLYLELEQDDFAEGSEEEIEYLEQSRLPRQSNLWNRLPKLRSFSVKTQEGMQWARWFNVTRDQWQKYQPL